MLYTSLTALLALSSVTIAAPSCTYITPDEASRVSKAFSAASIFPSVVTPFTPKVKVNAAFGKKAVNLGNQFSTLGKLISIKLSQRC